jgi:acetolactate synthase-1/2/3 large subunit
MAAKPLAAPEAPKVASSDIEKAAKALSSAKKPAILIGGPATYEEGLKRAGQVAKKTGALLFSDTFNKRVERGAGRVFAPPLPYFGEMALDALAGCDLLLIIGTKQPVAFFAYPGKPSLLVPEGCEALELCGRDMDVVGALTDLAAALDADSVVPDYQKAARPEAPPAGELTSGTIGSSIGALMPEGTVVVDEGVSNGIGTMLSTINCPPHDWLNLTGGSIGIGMPMATGAALGVPDRKVVCLEGDGSGMYTVQALRTMARENLDVTTVVFANRTYNILNVEFDRTDSGEQGEKAKSMLSIGNPDLDWVKMAEGMGVEATRVDTAEGFTAAFAAAMAQKGPRLIEAVVP